MVRDKKILGLPVTQAISLATFIAGVISVWVHLEIQIAAINVEIINLKKNVEAHCTENRKELDALKVDIKSDTREILKKIDEIQVYLRNQSKCRCLKYVDRFGPKKSTKGGPKWQQGKISMRT